MVFQTTMDGVVDFRDGSPFAMGLVAPCRLQGACYCFNVTPTPGIWRVEVMARILQIRQGGSIAVLAGMTDMTC
jgi:hypothetical protein